jgi:sugar phosphate isomerase/epimerase
LFRLGYNTNGLAHHRLEDALPLLAELGYRGVAITPDVGQLDPARATEAELRAVREAAAELDLALAVETGARFLLDPRLKHFPTLLEEAEGDRAVRVASLVRQLDLAAGLGAPVLSLWAGRAPDGAVGDGEGAEGSDPEAAWDRLCAGLEPVLAHAAAVGVRVGLEPEPGMFLERPAGWLELRRRLGSAGEALGLSLDVGHGLVTGDDPAEAIREHAAELCHVALDDMPRGEHLHMMFGLGDLDLEGVLRALAEVGYGGMAAVELSRDSHRGPQAAAEAMGHLVVALGRVRPD